MLFSWGSNKAGRLGHRVVATEKSKLSGCMYTEPCAVRGLRDKRVSSMALVEDGGFAFVKGINVAEKPFEVKEIIGVQLQSNEYFDSLSLKELLILFGKLYKNDVDVTELLNSVNLIDKINAKPEELSGGQKQRFSIACALVNKPDVLFLDEPTTGLDPQAKHNLWKLIRNLNQLGMSIVLTTHNMEEAENLCHKVAIMDKGKIITEGSPNDLIAKFDSDNTEKGNLENVFLHLTGRDLRD